MSVEIVEVNGQRVAIDRERRRLVVYYPVPVSALATAGPLARLWRDVCGRDAVLAADVGDIVGGLAVCAAGEADAWRAELRGGGAA